MSEVPVQVVIAAFRDEQGASKALQQLRQARDEGLIEIRDAAVIRRDAGGVLHTEDTQHHGIGRGALVGGVTGGVIGLLAGPVGWAAGAGALVGALAARLRDSGFPEERLKQVGEALKPGTSALVAVIEHRWAEKVAQELQAQAEQVAVASVQADIAEQLEAGRDVAYSVLSAPDGVVLARVTAERVGDEKQLSAGTQASAATETTPATPASAG
jgi:uncharacterized membrane protein